MNKNKLQKTLNFFLIYLATTKVMLKVLGLIFKNILKIKICCTFVFVYLIITVKRYKIIIVLLHYLNTCAQTEVFRIIFIASLYLFSCKISIKIEQGHASLQIILVRKIDNYYYFSLL